MNIKLTVLVILFQSVMVWNRTYQNHGLESNIENNQHNSKWSTNSCNNDLCTRIEMDCFIDNCMVRVCEDARCYHAITAKYEQPNIASKGGCSTVVCPKTCFGIHVVQSCPVCKCDGFGLQGICNSNSDCSSASCDENLCKVEKVLDNAPTFCSHDYSCEETEKCQSSTCVAADDGESHLIGYEARCAFDFSCPKDHICKDQTCWKGESDHIQDLFCIWDHQCPSGYSCNNNRHTCKNTGINHTDKFCIWDSQCPSEYRCTNHSCLTGGKVHIEGVHCVFDNQCQKGYACDNSTCYKQ